MQNVQRYDRGRLSRAGTTPTGGARVRANIARTGIQSYRMRDGSIRREYRSPDEVFAPLALDSFKGAALTIGHPIKVDPKTWSKDAVGVVHLPERAKLTDGHEYLVPDVDVTRQDALEQVDSGELVELSAGYTCDFDPTPGKDPVTGQAYDGVQRNIRANHVALLPEGSARAGRLARLHVDTNNDPDALRLDADGNQLTDEIPEHEPRMKILLNGKTYENEAELQAAVGALEADRTAQKDRADKAEKTAGAAEAKADTADKARQDQASKFDGAVSDEIDFRSKVAPILDTKEAKFDFKGKSRRDVHLAVVKTLRPAKEFANDASDVSVAAYFDALVEDWKPEPGAEKTSESYVAPPKKPVADEFKADADYLDDEKWAARLRGFHNKDLTALGGADEAN